MNGLMFIFMTNLELYNQYHKTLSTLNRCKKKYQELQDKRSVTLINGMIQDVTFALQGLEAYLPFKNRVYTLRKIKLHQKNIADIRSNDGVIPDGKLSTIKTPYDVLYDVDFRQALHSTIESVCNDDQKYLLTAYFMYGMTQEQIARKRGVKKARISRQLREIILKIRNSQLFSMYLMQNQ